VKADQKKQLKAQAHALNPVVMIGQHGLTDAVSQEIDIALDAHELIKIKIKIRAEKQDRIVIRDQIIEQTRAELIQTIGQMIVIYRKNKKS
jgi:RNA-binding protein